MRSIYYSDLWFQCGWIFNFLFIIKRTLGKKLGFDFPTKINHTPTFHNISWFTSHSGVFPSHSHALGSFYCWSIVSMLQSYLGRIPDFITLSILPNFCTFFMWSIVMFWFVGMGVNQSNYVSHTKNFISLGWKCFFKKASLIFISTIDCEQLYLIYCVKQNTITYYFCSIVVLYQLANITYLWNLSFYFFLSVFFKFTITHLFSLISAEVAQSSDLSLSLHSPIPQIPISK